MSTHVGAKVFSSSIMSFIAPQNFLFAGLIAAVVLLYILRLKRRERVISSTFLWESALRDLQANAPWQKLRSSLLMWLQIAFLVLAVLALVRPAIKVLSSGGQNIAIILDASASMQASDVAPSRFARAQSEALRLVNALSDGDRATILAAGAQTRVLASSRDKNVLKRAINNAQTQDTSCNLREAVVLSASLLSGKNKTSARGAQIYVLSDGAVAPLDDLSTGNIGLQFVKIGTRNDNLAITAMDVRRGYSQGSDYQIFATVRNFSSQQKTVNLELSHDGDLVVVRPLTIAAAGQASQLFENTGFKAGTFSVRFDADDDLKSDNAAYATLEAPRNLRVLLLSTGNPPLQKALNVIPDVQLFSATPGDYAASKTDAKYDVVVCDGVAPKGLPDANQLVFNAITDLSPVVKTGIAQAPGVVDWDRKHPVSRFAPWNDVRFTQSLAVGLKPWGQALVEAERTPLVVAGERDSSGGARRRVVWCGFDLRDSDLWTRIAFPIFVTNSLRWLSASGSASGGAGTTEGAPLRAGQIVPLDVPPATREIEVTAPDKSTQRVAVSASPALYDGANRVGIYSASTSGANAWKKTFAVNLLNAAESDLRPRDALTLSSGETVSGENRARANRELWGYLALCGLLLLGLEWWIYHRGA